VNPALRQISVLRGKALPGGYAQIAGGILQRGRERRTRFRVPGTPGKLTTPAGAPQLPQVAM
jgi:hypothetical protein